MSAAAGRWLPWAIGAAGLALAAVAGVDAVAIARPGAGWSLPPLPAAYDVASARLRRSDPARARALSRAALAWRPVDGRAWLDLALLDADGGGQLGAAARQELERSYETTPYDPGLAAERLALAYSHWPELPDDLRQAAVSEVRTTWIFPEQRGRLMAAVQQVSSPKGKLALAMELFRLKVAEDVAESRPGPAS